MAKTYEEIADGIREELQDQPDPVRMTYRLSLEPADSAWDQGRFNVFMATIYATLNTPQVHDTLAEPMDIDNPTSIEEKSRDIAQLSSWLSGMRSKSKSYLRAAKKAKQLPPNKKLWTDLDRKMELDAVCNQVITLCDLLDDLREQVLASMSLIQSLLRHVKQDRDDSLMQKD